jgi:hypothetical protein
VLLRAPHRRSDRGEAHARDDRRRHRAGGRAGLPMMLSPSGCGRRRPGEHEPAANPPAPTRQFPGALPGRAPRQEMAAAAAATAPARREPVDGWALDGGDRSPGP